MRIFSENISNVAVKKLITSKESVRRVNETESDFELKRRSSSSNRLNLFYRLDSIIGLVSSIIPQLLFM